MDRPWGFQPLGGSQHPGGPFGGSQGNNQVSQRQLRVYPVSDKGRAPAAKTSTSVTCTAKGISMNNPFKVQVPADVAAAASIKPKESREAEKQHNRAIEHRVRTASLHRPTITRSAPHARGR